MLWANGMYPLSIIVTQNIEISQYNLGPLIFPNKLFYIRCEISQGTSI